ncbi:MAG: UDP-N-acetylmuramoylalanyl-D-glutamate--2,6-diaminopimelate ligase [Gammaproteobacteria bacterium HGW-Gammaproteobacteria-10]|nr:MAG: UDP-N-acetylmuramoylalanyl-D-glutamate--2,6-diaminopimelate ligase [Gammaproteobacteria bacterium HGW-Gammaproteobacteria-10]
MNLMLSEIADYVGGVLFGEDRVVTGVSIDTRTIEPGNLYCAIKGERFDGNDFAGDAEQAGATAAILSRKVEVTMPIIVVPDTRLALAELAGYWRNRQSAQVVGITGSNGKTTVKEMTAAILGIQGPVLYTQGNLNNDIGVPLTLMRMSAEHRYAVIEMGANHAGEIAYTSRYAKPQVTIISNVGPAHLEGFGSVDGIARAKGEIIGSLGSDGTAVLNYDDIYFDYWLELAGTRKVLSFGLKPGADIRAENIITRIENGEFATAFEWVQGAVRYPMRLKLAGRHNVLNALAAGAAATALGFEPMTIKQGLEKVQPVTGRLQPLVGRQGNIVIDDTYNANSASLKAGLDVLIECGGEPWVVLGAFGELGPESAEIHREMGESMKTIGVKRLFATGSDARNTVQSFGEGGIFYETQDELTEALKREMNGHETLLVKGSRAQRMERVVGAIVENYRK